MLTKIESLKEQINQEFKIEVDAFREKRNARLKSLRKIEKMAEKGEQIFKGESRVEDAQALVNVLDELEIQYKHYRFATQEIIEFINESEEI